MDDFVKKSYIAGVQFAAIQRGVLGYPTDGEAERCVEKTAADLSDNALHPVQVVDHLVGQAIMAEKTAAVEEMLYKTAAPYVQAAIDQGLIMEKDAGPMMSSIMNKLRGAGGALKGLGGQAMEGLKGYGQALKNVPGELRAGGQMMREAPGMADKMEVLKMMLAGPGKTLAPAALGVGATGLGLNALLGGDDEQEVTASVKLSSQGEKMIEEAALPIFSKLIEKKAMSIEQAADMMRSVKKMVFKKVATGVNTPNTNKESVSAEMDEENAERPTDKYEAKRDATETTAKTENFPEDSEKNESETGKEKKASLDDVIAELVMEKLSDGQGTEDPNTMANSVDAGVQMTTPEQDHGVGASADLPSGDAEVGTEQPHPEDKDKGEETTDMAQGGPTEDASAEAKIANAVIRALLKKQADGQGTEDPNTMANSVDAGVQMTTPEQDHGVGASADLPSGDAEVGTEQPHPEDKDKGEETTDMAQGGPTEDASAEAKIANQVIALLRKKAEEGSSCGSGDKPAEKKPAPAEENMDEEMDEEAEKEAQLQAQRIANEIIAGLQ